MPASRSASCTCTTSCAPAWRKGQLLHVIASSVPALGRQSSFLRGLLEVVCQDETTFLFDCSHLFVPTVGADGWRAQVKSRPARRDAAKRLGLELSEHAIRLLWSGVSGRDDSFAQRSMVRAVFGSLGLRARPNSHSVVARGATAPQFRVRRAGSRGRDHSSLRHCEAMQSIGSSTRIGRG